MKMMQSTRSAPNAIKVTLLIAWSLCLGIGLSLRLSPASAQNPPGGIECPAQCDAWGQAYAQPRFMLFGESTTTVHLKPQFFCRSKLTRLRLVFVVDPDESMDRADLDALKDKLIAIAEGLDMPSTPELSIGIIQAAERPLSLVPLSNDIDRVRAGILRLRLDTNQDLAAGLLQAERMLARRPTPDCRFDPSSNDFVVTVSSDLSGNSCQDVAKEASKLKGKGILVGSACSTQNCIQSPMPSKKHRHDLTLFLSFRKAQQYRFRSGSDLAKCHRLRRIRHNHYRNPGRRHRIHPG